MCVFFQASTQTEEDEEKKQTEAQYDETSLLAFLQNITPKGIYFYFYFDERKIMPNVMIKVELHKRL